MLWNPDLQEQRFCWGCKVWFHPTCLLFDVFGGPTNSQAYYLELIFKQHSNVPKSIIEIAFQPMARGGNLHYTAGNIWFVNRARLLFNSTVQEEILSNTKPWMVGNMVAHGDNESSLWWEYMVYEYDIDTEDKDTEQLVVMDQVVYKCHKCRTSL